MVDECEIKVKIELINDGFLIFGPGGTFFREKLIDAVDTAVDEFEIHAPDAFRVLEDDVADYIAEMKRRAIKDDVEKLEQKGMGLGSKIEKMEHNAKANRPEYLSKKMLEIILKLDKETLDKEIPKQLILDGVAAVGFTQVEAEGTLQRLIANGEIVQGKKDHYVVI